ncbi:Putative zinc ribbon domain [uncultured Clostridium sp.]|nr:Putative zinc ribbon domain [uncultured Clostridium sp.]
MQERYCQCCGMPLGQGEEMLGNEADGRKSQDYCKYCYVDGSFTADCTMDEMIEFCVSPMVASNPGMSEDAAREAMRAYFPKLKRWRKD